MTSSVRLKSATYIEWTVPVCPKIFSYLPGISLRDESKPFMFQDCKCNFEFYTDTEEYNDARLFFKRRGTVIPELKVMVFASWISDSVRCTASPERRTVRNGYAEIWKHEAGKLLGTMLNFEIIIHAKLSKRDESIQTGSYLNADVSVESLSKDFSELLDSSQNYDAEIKYGEHSVKVHKDVLCARSEVFKAMLEGNLLESRTGIVDIQDSDINDIQDFVRYLYTGSLPELTFEKAKALYELGDKYLVRSLVLRLSEYLLDSLCPENACQFLILTDVHFDEKLKDRAIIYIIEEKIYVQEDLWRPFCNQCPKLANEVYRVLQGRSGSAKKVAPSSGTGIQNSTMTVLKKCK